MQTAIFVLLGYFSGSVLYARVFAHVFGKEDLVEKSRDKNPGAANAFMYGGFQCGVMTLVCDIAKAFFPVFLYMRYFLQGRPAGMGTALVLAAPVIGHTFPVFYRFKGGKGIAATFGCLLGLCPLWQPVATLAVFFVFSPRFCASARTFTARWRHTLPPCTAWHVTLDIRRC